MQLENFVNVMGVNVIQVIDQIQSGREGYQKKYVDADQYINKDWYQLHCRRRNRQLCSKDEEEKASKLQASKYFLSKISKSTSAIETLSSQQQKDSRTSTAARRPPAQQQQGDSKHQELVRFQSLSTSGETAEDRLTKPSISSSLTSVSPSRGGIYRVTSLCKTIDKNELIFPVTCLTGSPINTKLRDHVIHLVNSNDYNYNKQRDPPATREVFRNSLQDKTRSRVWKRPKSIRWCTSNEFLSKQIKTYRDACELVQRKRDVIVRVKDKKHEGDEYFDVNSTDSIEFILFPYT